MAELPVVTELTFDVVTQQIRDDHPVFDDLYNKLKEQNPVLVEYFEEWIKVIEVKDEKLRRYILWGYIVSCKLVEAQVTVNATRTPIEAQKVL